MDELFLIQDRLFMTLQAINSCNVTVSPDCSFAVGQVASYQEVSPDGEAQEQFGLETDQSETFPLLRMTNGYELFLNLEQKAIFQPLWNEKAAISGTLLSLSNAIHQIAQNRLQTILNAPPAQQLQP